MGNTNWKLISRKCCQNGHHLAQNRLTVTATLACDLLFGHNSAIFHSILTFFCLNCSFFETNRMVTKSKLFLLWFRFYFLAQFFASTSRPHIGIIACMDTKPPSKGQAVAWPSPSTHISKSSFPK